MIMVTVFLVTVKIDDDDADDHDGGDDAYGDVDDGGDDGENVACMPLRLKPYT